MKLRTLFLALAAVFAPLASAELLYTVREADDVLSTIDTATGNVSAIGALGVNFEFGDLAFDQSTNTMYAVGGWGNGIGAVSDLFSVNLTTGAATLIGSTGQRDVFGLVWDPTTGKLFGSASTISTGFFEINKTTGAGSLIGTPGISLDALTYDGSTGNILGMFAGPGSLHYVDRNTGAATLANGGSGFVNNNGMAYVGSNNSVYSLDWSGDFYRYDLSNSFARTTITNVGAAYDGLAAVPEPATMVALGAGLLALARRRRK
ncbi:MAG: PEP-CTERM sorting domain-containing protein [Fimbriimonadaceae bacterium]